MKYPNVTQKVIFRYQDKVLIFQHPDGSWDFPGGQLEWGEDLLGGLNRELEEEMSFSLPKIPKLFHVWNYISEDKSRHSVMIYYLWNLDEQPELNTTEDHKFKWLTKKDMTEAGIIKDDPDFRDKIFV